MIPGLAARHRVIAPDLTAYGASDGGTGSVAATLDEDVAVVRAALDLGGARCHLVGHSYSGLLALIVARAVPGRLASLTLVEPVVFSVLDAGTDADAMADFEAVGAHFLPAIEAGAFDTGMERFVDYWNGPGAWRQLGDEARRAVTALAPKVYREVSAIVADGTPLAAYRQVRPPTLLMVGSRTTPAAARIAAVLGAAIPDCRTAVIQGAGHMAPMTHAEDVAAALEDHIRRNPAGDTARRTP
jgi:pimeloyl-ACP methyl ester carboxylesterase